MSAITFATLRGVDVNKRTVTTNFYSLKGIRFGHNMSSCLFSFSVLATSWPKLRLAIIECMFLTFSLRFSC